MRVASVDPCTLPGLESGPTVAGFSKFSLPLANRGSACISWQTRNGSMSSQALERICCEHTSDYWAI